MYQRYGAVCLGLSMLVMTAAACGTQSPTSPSDSLTGSALPATGLSSPQPQNTGGQREQLRGRPGFVFPAGCCYYEGEMVRTVVPPARAPHEGLDDFFAVMGGVPGQKAVVAVAPGDTNYHGGKWAFYSVTWNVPPYLLTSEAEVLAAEGSGDVTITRVAANDFKCPIQFGPGRRS